MIGGDRSSVPTWTLVLASLVLAWPQISAWVPGASTWYPLVTCVLTLLMVAIVVSWPPADNADAGRAATMASTKAAVAIIAALAAALIAVAAYRWTRLLAWQPYQADMLIVI